MAAGPGLAMTQGQVEDTEARGQDGQAAALAAAAVDLAAAAAASTVAGTAAGVTTSWVMAARGVVVHTIVSTGVQPRTIRTRHTRTIPTTRKCQEAAAAAAAGAAAAAAAGEEQEDRDQGGQADMARQAVVLSQGVVLLRHLLRLGLEEGLVLGPGRRHRRNSLSRSSSAGSHLGTFARSARSQATTSKTAPTKIARHLLAAAAAVVAAVVVVVAAACRRPRPVCLARTLRVRGGCQTGTCARSAAFRVTTSRTARRRTSNSPRGLQGTPVLGQQQMRTARLLGRRQEEEEEG